MSTKPDDGLTPREFAKLDGCSETLVRRKVKSGYLPVMPNGRISPAYVGTGWRKSARPDAKPVSSVKASELEARREDETRASRPLKGVTAQPECPDWLIPARDCENHFDRGILFAVLSLVRDVGALAAIAADDAGATIETAKRVEQTMPTLFAERAEDLMRRIGVGPYEHADEPLIWPRAMGLRIDWKRVADDAKPARGKKGGVREQ